ncbi:hypothetical protein K3495_g3796 [Podosphaera aphanis]|nr:hypothetical protein K3495_g3796 [Podosphaera aphanis]
MHNIGYRHNTAHQLLQEAVKIWKSRTRLPHISEGEIIVRWVPSHAGIEGNELADAGVKKGAATPFQNNQSKLSVAALALRKSSQMCQAREKWWENNAPQSYVRLGINTAPYFREELLLSRKALGQVIAARSGHGDFASYHTRFNHRDANMHCLCGSPKSPKHFLFCRIRRRRHGHPDGPIRLLLPKLLGTPEGAVILTNWLGQAQFYEQISPR